MAHRLSWPQCVWAHCKWRCNNFWGKVLMRAATRTTVSEFVMLTSPCKWRVGLPGGSTLVMLSRAIFVTKVAHRLVSYSSLRDDAQTKLFGETCCVVKKKNTVVGVVNTGVECGLLRYRLMVITPWQLHRIEKTCCLYGIQDPLTQTVQPLGRGGERWCSRHGHDKCSISEDLS